jgi:tetratricopeptide (TPR) repeat protein
VNSRDTKFVGRSKEVTRIEESLSALTNGQGSVLMLVGEPGIGKSTLARFAVASASERQISTHLGFCWEAGEAPPYWPWTQALGSLVADRSIESVSAAKLGQILPQFAGDDDDSLQPEQARFLLMEAVRSLLNEASESAPLLLVFEDLHAADPDTLQLLQYVTRHVRHMPVMILGTFRDAEARRASAEPLWHSAREAEILQLDRLGDSDVREYLAATNSEVDDDFVELLLGTSGGNPLFLVELVGVLSRQRDFDPAVDRLPETIQQVIRSQLEALSEDTQSILQVASVLGRTFSLPDLADLVGSDLNDVASRLSEACDAEVVLDAGGDNRQFVHALYRDVLYQSMESVEREELHRRRAESVQRLIDDGDHESWVDLASNLSSAGHDYRLQAIDAWRQAAKNAQRRLAFDEGVRRLDNALQMFGAGPRFAPADRADLIMELAAANIAKGDYDRGQSLCKEAFELARTVGDPKRMAEAALTYGSIFIVSKVDRTMVALLKESLEHLPKNEVALTARVTARLAAAMQPADDPSVPMATARDALALARTTNDESVIFPVLKSAVSAIMDFAPVNERVLLNLELEKLAQKYNDTPGLFRSYLRLIIDFSELGDREKLDAIIDRCDQIAERIGLPHYQWRVTSARAMLATLEGRYSAAMALLDDAEKLAAEVGDESALITVAIQRFAILYDWEELDVALFTNMEQRFTAAFEQLPDAEAFVIPMFASFAYRAGIDSRGESILDERMTQRLFAGGDRFCISKLGELAVHNDQIDLVRKVYDTLLPHKEYCETLGLLGTTWAGPVSYSLGHLATAIGEPDAAMEHFERALIVAKRMRAEPMLARILEGMAHLARLRGDDAECRSLTDQSQRLIGKLRLRPTRIALAEAANEQGEESIERPIETSSITVTQDGDVWHVAYKGQSVLVKNTKGMLMLAELLSNPDTDIHVLDLSGAGVAASDTGDAGPALDHKARQEYRQRVTDLQDELEDAAETGDIGRSDAIHEELDFISRELSRAFGLGGRERRPGAAAERARVNVRRRLKDAIERVAEHHPDAGRYLENTIKTGGYCRYAPL